MADKNHGTGLSTVASLLPGVMDLKVNIYFSALLLLLQPLRSKIITQYVIDFESINCNQSVKSNKNRN